MERPEEEEAGRGKDATRMAAQLPSANSQSQKVPGKLRKGQGLCHKYVEMGRKALVIAPIVHVDKTIAMMMGR